MVPNGSQNGYQMDPKRVPKGSQMDPKWVPKGVTRGLQDTKTDIARFCGDPGPLWEPFWGPVGSKGGPKIQLLGTKAAYEASKIVFRKGVDKRFEKCYEIGYQN